MFKNSNRVIVLNQGFDCTKINCNFVLSIDAVNSVTRRRCRCNKKLSYCWETVRRESMPRIAEMDVEMTT